MKRKVFIYVLLLLFQLICFPLLGNFKWFQDFIFIPIYTLKSKIASFISNCFSFSIGDVLYILVALFLLYYIFIVIKSLIQKDILVLKKQLYRVLKVTNIVVFVYYFAWGFIYSLSRLDYQYNTKEIQVSELKNLAENYLKECVFLRNNINENNIGILDFKLNSSELKRDLLGGYQDSNIPKNINFSQTYNIKPSLFSYLLNYFGIGGYFNPFTEECQININASDFKIPFTASHELSHQLGFGRENEASFVGFVLAEKSKNKEVQYSAKFYALRSLLNNLYSKDSIYVLDKVNNYSEGMKRDKKADSLLQIKYSGRVEKYFESLNNLFLKANKQEGVVEYSKFINLLVGYKRSE